MAEYEALASHVKAKGGLKLKVLVCGGGAAVADDCTNVLLSSTRMELLGLAAGMSYARRWAGEVQWRVDNTSARRQPPCVASGQIVCGLR